MLPVDWYAVELRMEVYGYAVVVVPLPFDSPPSFRLPLHRERHAVELDRNPVLRPAGNANMQREGDRICNAYLD